MAISYTVAADVIDIGQDTPRETDIFFVDTNAWYWLTYTPASLGARTWQSIYPDYLNSALANKTKLHYSGLSLAELAHTIEKTERRIHDSSGTIKTKEYRHNFQTERNKVVSEIESVWQQIINLADPLAITIDDQITNAALNRLQSQKVDGYDLFILESMKSHDTLQIITDDGDYATVPGIQVFTANRNVIEAAANQSKLIIR